MRFAQPKEERKTWPKLFLSLLHEQHADYHLNKLVKGTYTECIRVVDGLFVSQNTFCLRGRYNHCYALSLTNKKTPHLESIFFLGNRFDHNQTISYAFSKDLELNVGNPKRPKGLSDTHQLRIGAEQIVRNCTKNADEYLFPHYRAKMLFVRPLLLELISFYSEHKNILQDDEYIAFNRIEPIYPLTFSLQSIAHHSTEIMKIPAVKLIPAIVTWRIQDFITLESDLPNFYTVLERLK